jgi:phage terminase large subunit GpA-like protein
LLSAAEIWRPSERLDPAEWGRKNRIYPETAGVPGPRRPELTPYMIPWSNAVHSGEYRRVVAMTAAQSGKTDNMLDIIGARLDQRPAPIIYVGPTREFLTDQFEPRLMALLDEAASLKNKVVRGRRMKKTLKWVAGVRLRLAHGSSSVALKSDPAALALIDEYDAMMADVDHQGDVLGLVEARGETYADFVTAVTSTPSRGLVETEHDELSGLDFWQVVKAQGGASPIQSPIWTLWQEGTRHHWAWPCRHCGRFFIPRFKLLQWPKLATPVQARDTAWIYCPHCGSEHTEADKQWLNAHGAMVAPGQTVALVEDAAVVSGHPPPSTTLSFWTSGLCSPFVSFGQRAETYMTALESGDDNRVQTAMNASFGELFSPIARGDVPEWQEVMSRRLPYRMGDVPLEVIRLVAGVDVQKRSLYYVIRGFGGRAASWLVGAGQLYGATEDDEVWSQLTDLILSPIGGVQIERCFIDSGFRPNKPDRGDEHKVYAYCRQLGFIVQATKGHATQASPLRVAAIEVTTKGKKRPYSLNLIHLDTDFFKSMVHSRLRTPAGQPGAMNFPEDITEDYARQLVSEVRVVSLGQAPQWILRTRLNHYLDCEAMAMAAGYMLNVHRLPPGMVRPRGEPPPEPTPPTVSPADETPSELPVYGEPPALPAPPPSPRGDLRSRMAAMSIRLNR